MTEGLIVVCIFSRSFWVCSNRIINVGNSTYPTYLVDVGFCLTHGKWMKPWIIINFSIMCNYCLHKSLRGRWCGILTRPIVHLSTFGVTIYLAHRINSMYRLWMQKRKVLSLEWKSDVTTRTSLFSVRRTSPWRQHPQPGHTGQSRAGWFVLSSLAPHMARARRSRLLRLALSKDSACVRRADAIWPFPLRFVSQE